MRQVFTVKFDQRFKRGISGSYVETVIAADVYDACNKLRHKAFAEELDGLACTHVRIREVISGPEVTM